MITVLWFSYANKFFKLFYYVSFSSIFLHAKLQFFFNPCFLFKIDPKPSVQRGQLPPSKPLQNKSLDKKVFVGGVAQGTSEDGLRKFFDSQNLPVS